MAASNFRTVKYEKELEGKSDLSSSLVVCAVFQNSGISHFSGNGWLLDGHYEFPETD